MDVKTQWWKGTMTQLFNGGIKGREVSHSINRNRYWFVAETPNFGISVLNKKEAVLLEQPLTINVLYNIEITLV